MKMNVYSVKDNKVGFSNVWYANNDNEAIRNFEDALNDERSALSKHPLDMELYGIGTWEDQTGTMTSEVRYITNGTEKYKPKNKLDKLDEETLKKVVIRLTEIENNLTNAKASQIKINKELEETSRDMRQAFEQIKKLDLTTKKKKIKTK